MKGHRTKAIRMKKLLFIAIMTLCCNSASATEPTELDLKVDQIQQYVGTDITTIFFTTEFTPTGNCQNNIYGPKGVILKSSDAGADQALTVALSAVMSGKKVNIGLTGTCYGTTDKLHWIRIKN
ncbi:MAG: hypothetical protein D3922_11240 [Candidatus Electrothrix sp. AR1]|nr:hypothetical protein [Candidatus Electrothrix sp. AR1]